MAQRFASWVEGDDRFELAAPTPLNLVCFRHKGGETHNQKLLDRINQSGDLYMTHSRLDSKLTLRFCVGQTSTEFRHVEQAWKKIKEVSGELGANPISC